MAAGRAIAEEVSRYLRAQPASQASRGTAPGSAGETAGAELTRAAPARGVGETAGGIAGWIWRMVEPRVKQQICTQENQARLGSITTDQLASRVEEILTPLVTSVIERLPAFLRFLVPLLPPLRKRIAGIIAQELQRMGAAGWAAYCGVSPRT